MFAIAFVFDLMESTVSHYLTAHPEMCFALEVGIELASLSVHSGKFDLHIEA